MQSEPQEPEDQDVSHPGVPEDDRPFRVWTLLGVIALTVVILAGISALIDRMVLAW